MRKNTNKTAWGALKTMGSDVRDDNKHREDFKAELLKDLSAYHMYEYHGLYPFDKKKKHE